MRPAYRVVVVLAALAAFQGVQACASEAPDPGLNPQPLPPQEEEKNDNRAPGEAQEPTTGAGGSTSGSSSGGSSGLPAADGDAGDGGGDSGGDN